MVATIPDTDTIGVSTVRKFARQGVIGLVAFLSDKAVRRETRINGNPFQYQIDEVVIDTATDDTAYSYDVNGVTITINSGAGATKSSIRDALIATHNATPTAYGKVVASSGTDKVVLTGQYPGLPFTLAEDDANLSLHSVQAASNVPSVPVGRVLFETGISEDGRNRTAMLATSAALSAQVATLEATFAATAGYFVEITFDDDTIPPIFAFAAADTDDDTTATAIRAAIEAAAPAHTVTAGGATHAITITSEVKGQAFSVRAWTTATAGAALAITDTGRSHFGVSIDDLIAGLAEFTTDLEPDERYTGDAVYGNSKPINVVTEGPMFVADGANASGEPAWTDGVAVYVETDPASANVGKLFPSRTATRVRSRRLSIVAAGRVASDNVAIAKIAPRLNR